MEDSESKKVENYTEKDQEKLKLNRQWSFWENYESKTKQEKD